VKTCTLGVKKPRRSDMDRLNPCGDQASHFASWMENLNVANFAYNHKMVGTTSKTRPTTCVSSMSKGRPQGKASCCSKVKCTKMC
jgi:hypothetical protein